MEISATRTLINQVRQAWLDVIGDQPPRYEYRAFNEEGDNVELLISNSAFGYCSSDGQAFAWRWEELKSFRQVKDNAFRVKCLTGEKSGFRMVDKLHLSQFFLAVQECSQEAGFVAERKAGWFGSRRAHFMIRPRTDLVPEPAILFPEPSVFPFEEGYLTPAIIWGPRARRRYREAAVFRSHTDVTRRLSFPDNESDVEADQN